MERRQKILAAIDRLLVAAIGRASGGQRALLRRGRLVVPAGAGHRGVHAGRGPAHRSVCWSRAGCTMLKSPMTLLGLLALGLGLAQLLPLPARDGAAALAGRAGGLGDRDLVAAGAGGRPRGRADPAGAGPVVGDPRPCGDAPMARRRGACLSVFWTASHLVDRRRRLYCPLRQHPGGLPRQHGARRGAARRRDGGAPRLDPAGTGAGVGADARRPATGRRHPRRCTGSRRRRETPRPTIEKIAIGPGASVPAGNDDGRPRRPAGDRLDGDAAGAGVPAAHPVAAREPRGAGGPAGALGSGEPGRAPDRPPAASGRSSRG